MRTVPKLPRTSTVWLGSAVCVGSEARFCSIAPGKPAPPAVATARSLGRVEYGTRPATEGITSMGSMIVTTKVESSVHSPL